jgi:VCBS repeat-containing protein
MFIPRLVLRKNGRKMGKKRLFVILSCVMFFLFEHSFLLSDAMGADCPEDIAGYWSLDETDTDSYADAIGANNGSCIGIACPGWTSGTVGNGQLFNGIDTITMSADTGNFNWSAGQSFTIELWMRHNTGTISSLEAFIGRADAAGLNWYIGINSFGYAQARLRAADGSGPGTLTVSKDLRSASDDLTWHHVALVRNADTNTTTLYVDGESSTPQSFTYASGFASDTAPLTLGALDGGSRLDDGALDEVAIYGRALGSDELKSHYYLARGYCSRYDEPVKIMPMGDSITTGVWTGDPVVIPAVAQRIGYRYHLWQLLGSNRFMFEYNGSEHHGSGHDPLFDDHHAGFDGIEDGQLATLLSTGINPDGGEDLTGGGPYLDAFPADFILLHIGTNGVESDQSANDVEAILEQIDKSSQNTTVLLAEIINQAPVITAVDTFNTAVKNMANNRIAEGDKIIMIDIDGYNGNEWVYQEDREEEYTNGDMYDYLHPNPAGYKKMADKWFATLETILPQSELPAIASTEITDAVKDELYNYTVVATGSPSPEFELTENPAPGDMTIDAVSGLIEWTPEAVGDYQVTVRAYNWTGEDTQSFTISVNVLPQAAGDAYNGILEGETLTVSAAQGVLSNDTDENDPLSAILFSDVTYGTLNLNSDGSFTYTHDGSENFSDSFTYMASDGKAESAPTTVTLTITPVNDPGSGGGGSGCFITALF